MPTNSRLNNIMPPVTKHLLIINALVWLATMVLQMRGVDLTSILGLHYWRGSDFHLHQLFTYMFMHDSSSFQGGLMHIFFNMFSLWMFGGMLERVMGNSRYLLYYIVCGLGAGLVQELSWEWSWQSILADINNVSTSAVQKEIAAGYVTSSFLNEFYNNLITVGASGAVFGILLAFAFTFPNMPMYLWFIPIPVKAKWMVLGYGLIELFFGVTGRMDNVAHFAHLGGMLFGLLLLLYWMKTGVMRRNTHEF